MRRWAVGNVFTGPVGETVIFRKTAAVGKTEVSVMADIWTHDDVERRLREAMTTLRRIPMHANGMPATDHATWPEYAYNAADRADWIIGADTPEYLRRNEADQNRIRLHATRDQIRELDECLDWLAFIRDGRKRKVVFARSHVWPESERPMASFNQIAHKMNTNRETVRQWYRAGIKRIAMELSNGKA